MTCKPAFCAECPIDCVTDGYVPLSPPSDIAHELWVGESSGDNEAREGRAFVGGAGTWLDSLCRAGGVSRKRARLVNTIGCRPPKNVYPTDPQFVATARAQTGIELAATAGWKAVRYCAEKHLWPAVNAQRWTRIVALGDVALGALTPRRGILLWHGSPLPLRGRESEGPKVIPVYHPAFLMRQASLFSVAARDLRRQPVVPPENYNLWPTLDEVRAFDAKEFVFDFEWNERGEISLCGLSDRLYRSIVVPWERPYLEELQRIFESATLLIGHNIVDADMPYLRPTGWEIKARLFDTLLAQHLIQPDMRHGLGFVASVYSSKVYWKGSGEDSEDESTGEMVGGGAQWKTWNSAEAIPREFGGYGGCASADEAFRLYNARDCDGNFQCYGGIAGDLKRYGLDGVYWNVSLPAAQICEEICRPGLKLDPGRVGEIRDRLNAEIGELEVRLPEGLRPYEKDVIRQVAAPEGTWRPGKKVCKGSKKEGTHGAVELWFTVPGGVVDCGVCGRQHTPPKMSLAKVVRVPGKERIVPWNSSPQVMAYAKSLGAKEAKHSKTGRPTADKNARKTWGREHTEFALLDTLKKHATIRNTFVKEELLGQARMYYDLLVYGTAEGRLSSRGRRKGVDLNIQNQPKSVRGIYVPDRSDWGMLDADIIQGENMLTAWLAKDWERWERLQTPGFDEHSYMASQFFNKAIESVSKGGVDAYLRDPGKVINHGRNYGLGVRKTVDYLAAQGFFYSEADVKEMIEIWKKVNWRTAQWQRETTQMAERQSYLENPFGRRRWFQCVTPDTLTLTDEAQWKPLGGCKVGDTLLAFDETLDHACFQPSTITYMNRLRAPVFSIATTKGIIRATENHGWAVRVEACGRTMPRWITTRFLQKGDKIIAPLRPWTESTNPDALWLGGLLDREGCIMKAHHRGEVRLAQNPGPVLDRAVKVARDLGWIVSEPRLIGPGFTGKKKVLEIRLSTGRPGSALEIASSLGTTRLLAKALTLWNGQPFGNIQQDELAEVLDVVFEGEQDIITLSTTTKTLFTGGLCSHNSRDYATKALAFLPASTLADMVLRMMIALYAEKFPSEVGVLGIGVTAKLPSPWGLRIQVHDSLVAQGPHEMRYAAADALRAVMTQPWRELEGFVFGVEMKYSQQSWGEVKELK